MKNEQNIFPIFIAPAPLRKLKTLAPGISKAINEATTIAGSSKTSDDKEIEVKSVNVKVNHFSYFTLFTLYIYQHVRTHKKNYCILATILSQLLISWH